MNTNNRLHVLSHWHYLLLIFLFTEFLPPLIGQTQTNEFKVFGYLPAYREHLIDSVQMDGLTHLCIGFANPNKRGKLSVEGREIGPMVEKAKAANVKVLISLAGGGIEEHKSSAWNYFLKSWNRDKLINEITRWVLRYNLDGVDVDLEWGNVNQDYSGFVIALKNRLSKHNKILTAALPGKFRYKHLSDAALKAFDYVLVMAYDLKGPWAPKDVGQHAPYSFANNSIRFWKEQGVESSKIILGLPFYGWNFNKKSRRVYSVTYGFMVSRDSSFAQFNQVGSAYYNGLPMIQAKTELAMEKAGGVMFWEMGQDNFGDYSLAKATYDIIQQKYQEALPPPPIEIASLPAQKIDSNQVNSKDQKHYNKLVLSNASGSLVWKELIEREEHFKLPMPKYIQPVGALFSISKYSFITDKIITESISNF